MASRRGSNDRAHYAASGQNSSSARVTRESQAFYDSKSRGSAARKNAVAASRSSLASGSGFMAAGRSDATRDDKTRRSSAGSAGAHSKGAIQITSIALAGPVKGYEPQKHSGAPILDQSSVKTYFILLQDKEVHASASDSLLSKHQRPASQKILTGALLEGFDIPPDTERKSNKNQSTSRTGKRYIVKQLGGGAVFECSGSEMGRLTSEEKDLLKPFHTDGERLSIYCDKTQIHFALSLKQGSFVQVKVRHDHSAIYENADAVVRYIGPLSGNVEGTQFGVELIDPLHRGHGTSDGEFGKTRYFQTDSDCALFVTLAKLVPCSDEKLPAIRQGLTALQKELTHHGTPELGMTVCFESGDTWIKGKVVFMTLPPGTQELHLAVEMPLHADAASRQHWDGKYNGKHLFTPRNNACTYFIQASSAIPEHLFSSPEEGKHETTKNERSSTLPRVETKGQKPSNSKPHSKSNSPYGSSDKLDKSSKAAGGRRDITKGYGGEKTKARRDMSDDLPYLSGHFSEDSKSKPDSLIGVLKGKADKFRNKFTNGSKDEQSSKSQWFEASSPGTDANKGIFPSSRDTIEEDVVEEVTNVIYRDWRTIAYHLYLTNEDIDFITSKAQTSKEQTKLMLETWQKRGDGFDKISCLAAACRASTFTELADDLEQGLDEDLLIKIAEGISRKKVRPFGLNLNLPDDELDKIEAKTPSALPMVRVMLAKWRARQSHNSDKIMLLSNALHNCGLRQLELEVARGLDDDILLTFAVQIGHNWKILAMTLRVDMTDIKRLEDFPEDKQPYQMLMLWRRKQPRNIDILGALYKGLRESGLRDLSSELVQGVDDELLYKLSTMIGDGWESVALHLGFTDKERKDLGKGKTSGADDILNMLTKWRERHDYATSNRFDFLMKALKRSGLEKVAESFERDRQNKVVFENVTDWTKGANQEQASKTGVDDKLLYKLSTMIGDAWEFVALHLGFTDKETDDLGKGKTSGAVDILNMLTKWRERHDYANSNRFDFLMKALRESGLHKVAESFERDRQNKVVLELDRQNKVVLELDRQNKDVYENVTDWTKGANQEQAAKTAPPQDMVSREILLEVANNIGFRDLCRAVEVSTEDEIEIEKYYESNERRAFQLLDAWKRRGADGERSVDELIQVIIHVGGRKDLIDYIMNTYVAPSKDMVSREILLKVAKNIDYRDLCRVVDVSAEDSIKIENYQSNEQRVFQLLDAWKRSGTDGERSVIELNQVIAHVGGSKELIDDIMRTYATVENKEDPHSKELSPSNFTAAAPSIDNDEPPDEPIFPGLEVNSMVEVPGVPGGEMRYGVIRWIGSPEGSKSTKPVAGIELESVIAHGATDGTFNQVRYFQCVPRRALFVYLSKCKPDSRFPSEAQTFQSWKRQTSQDFGGFESPLVKGFVDPPESLQGSFVGMGKGIQGDQNSCYLDTTLFSMFAYNGVFDPLLRRSQGKGDLELYEEVQKTLRESIVNPLRVHGFVRADRVLQLREHLDHLGTTKGLMSEEKDPEEFLHTLLSEVFKSKPLLRKRHGISETIDESNIYQIVMDKDESFTLPTVEQLLLQSFQEQNLKLVEAPSCLIVQMPRFGKAFKMYKRILPSLQLDITNIIQEYPRQCCVCGNLAVFECNLCKSDEAVADTTLIKNYCKECFEAMHSSIRTDHKPTDLNNPDNFVMEYFSKTMKKGYTEQEVDRHHQSLLRPKLMDLFAVICIHTSHYVAFVKAGRAADSEWVFFDSMADRQGDQQGFNIPQITHLKDFRRWVDKKSIQYRIEHHQLTDMIERLMGDAYICMYSDTDMNNSTYV